MCCMFRMTKAALTKPFRCHSKAAPLRLKPTKRRQSRLLRGWGRPYGSAQIPVYGGSVTVFGRSMPTGAKAVVMGREVPVDAEGAFVVQRILPPGDHDVEVALAAAVKASASTAASTFHP